AAKAAERAGHLFCIEPKPKQRMKDNMLKYGVDENYTLIPEASPWMLFKRIPDNLDLLFIDGRHDIRWCLCDYHYWVPKIRKGGVIVFHDYSGGCAEDKRHPDYGKPGYVGLVARAVSIILETDNLKEIGRSEAPRGGAIAFEKP
ncbi:unnamed protein product, partial [marine sediment metagenome]